MKQDKIKATVVIINVTTSAKTLNPSKILNKAIKHLYFLGKMVTSKIANMLHIQAPL